MRFPVPKTGVPPPPCRPAEHSGLFAISFCWREPVRRGSTERMTGKTALVPTRPDIRFFGGALPLRRTNDPCRGAIVVARKTHVVRCTRNYNVLLFGSPRARTTTLRAHPANLSVNCHANRGPSSLGFKHATTSVKKRYPPAKYTAAATTRTPRESRDGETKRYFVRAHASASAFVRTGTCVVVNLQRRQRPIAEPLAATRRRGPVTRFDYRPRTATDCRTRRVPLQIVVPAGRSTAIRALLGTTVVPMGQGRVGNRSTRRYVYRANRRGLIKVITIVFAAATVEIMGFIFIETGIYRKTPCSCDGGLSSTLH